MREKQTSGNRKLELLAGAHARAFEGIIYGRAVIRLCIARFAAGKLAPVHYWGASFNATSVGLSRLWSSRVAYKLACIARRVREGLLFRAIDDGWSTRRTRICVRKVTRFWELLKDCKFWIMEAFWKNITSNVEQSIIKS